MNERKRLKWDYTNTKTIRDYCGHKYDDKHAFFLYAVSFFSNMYCLKIALQMIDPLYVVPCIGAQYKKALLPAFPAYPM